jgi:di/tripeptidase
VLADDSVVHGPLEVLLTMTEEAGMDGAFGLQANWLQADILISRDVSSSGCIRNCRALPIASRECGSISAVAKPTTKRSDCSKPSKRSAP